MKNEDIMGYSQSQRPFRPISCKSGLHSNSSPRDPLARLQKQLLNLIVNNVRIIAAQSRPWASATFIGAQHLLTVEIEEDTNGHAAQAFADALPEAEFAIPGHIVADAVVDSQEIQIDSSHKTSVLRLTFLTIEDW